MCSAFVLLVAGGCPQADESKQAIIRVTGIPDESPTELMRRSAPMVAYLSEALGRPVKYVPVTDYGAAVQALAAGRIDFAWLGGFTHVQARNLAEVEPMVMRRIDRNFKSVFLASAESSIVDMAQLKGHTFAFGSKSSTSGHLMPRYYLKTQYALDPDHDFDGLPVYSGAHDATVKMVESGKIEAGAVNKEVWERMLSIGKVDARKVRVIWTTPGYVDYVWTARKVLDEDVRQKFARAFLSLRSDDPKHREILGLQGAKGFVAAAASDFDAIEEVARSTGLLKR